MTTDTLLVRSIRIFTKIMLVPYVIFAMLLYTVVDMFPGLAAVGVPVPVCVTIIILFNSMYLGSVIIAFRRKTEAIGGKLLVVCGVVTLVTKVILDLPFLHGNGGFDIWNAPKIGVLLVLVLPAMVAGSLFVLCHRRSITIEEYKRVREYFLGDYYPLTEYSTSKKDWIGWQYHRTDLDAGIVQAFKREDCEKVSTRFHLMGLSPDVSYEMTDHDSGEKTVEFGSVLIQDGLVISRSERLSSVLIEYKPMIR